MRKHVLVAVSVFALSAAAFAEEHNGGAVPAASPAGTKLSAPATGEAPHQEHDDRNRDWTLTEARQKAHEKADKLDKMTEAEWAEHQKKRHERREKHREFMQKWHNMSDTEKEEFRKKRAERRASKAAGGNGAASPAQAAPQAPAQ